VNALANEKVAEYINENFVATYMKVGTFQIVNGQKQGGNVASYFCQPTGEVVHAVPGQVTADTLLSEASWAVEARKFALTRSTDLKNGVLDEAKYRSMLRKAHMERFNQARNPGQARINMGYVPPLPKFLPKNLSTQAQANWLLAQKTLAPIEDVFPIVWEQILNEKLSVLPVAMR
jgi:hypothetical protein